LAAQHQHVGEALGGEERRAGAAPFEEGIGGRGGAVGEAGVGRHVERGQALGHGLVLRRGGGHLAHAQRAAGAVEHDEVGEGAAYVDPYERTVRRRGGVGTGHARGGGKRRQRCKMEIRRPNALRKLA
jgi:hypothetical protein